MDSRHNVSESLENPFFLVGSERSGTTLLRLMLDYHPEISCLSEFEFAVDQVSDDGRWPDLRDYYDYLSTHRIFDATSFEIDPSLDYPGLIKDFLRQKQQENDGRIVGATVHKHFDRLRYIWREARYIHLLRDPRDVAKSCIGMGWAGNVWHGAATWIEAQRTWERVENMIPESRRIVVRFEDLVSDTKGTLARICEFLGTHYDQAMLEYAEHTTYSLPTAEAAHRWKRKLTDEEIRLVEARAGSYMERAGISLSGKPRLVVTPALKRRLNLQDRLYRIRFRMKRYGFPLTMSELIARRMRITPVQKRLQLRINAIDTSYLK